MAFEWYIKSTELGDSDGNKNNECKTFVNYQKSSELDNDEESYIVGYCYQNEIGMTIDKRAFVWNLKPAEVKSPDGRGDIGWCYQCGIDVERWNEKGNGLRRM